MGEEVLGTTRLSEMHQTIKRQIIDSVSLEKKDQLRNESKYIRKEINYRLKKKEDKHNAELQRTDPGTKVMGEFSAFPT